MKQQDSLTLTVTEAAIALGISRNLAYDMARAGKLPVVRLGRRLLVSRAALERMLQDCGVNNTPPHK